jgi:WD40 repeat protein
VDSAQEAHVISTEMARRVHAYSLHKKRTVFVHNLAEKTDRTMLPQKCQSGTCAFSPATPSLLAFSCWEKLNVWDVTANKTLVSDLTIPFAIEQIAPRDSKRSKCDVCLYIHHMAFTSNGTLLALARTPVWEKREYAGHATLFDMNKMQVAEVQPHGDMGGIRGVAFTADDQYLVGGGYDTYVRIWEVKTGREITQLYGHTDVIETLAICPDGRFLATGAMNLISSASGI